MKVYLLDINAVTRIPDRFFEENFPQRFQRLQKFRLEKDKLRSKAAAILLHSILGCTEKDIILGPHGKPTSSNIPQKFSLSHSGDYALLGVSDREIGVDLELMDRSHICLAEKVFLAEEVEWMRGKREEGEGSEKNGQNEDIAENEDTEQRFFSLWTMKESVSKALGQGILLPFDSFSVLPLLEGREARIEGKTFYGKNILFDGYSLSACTEGVREELEMEFCEGVEERYF